VILFVIGLGLLLLAPLYFFGWIGGTTKESVLIALSFHIFCLLLGIGMIVAGLKMGERLSKHS